MRGPRTRVFARAKPLFSFCDPGGTVSPILVRPVREQLEHDRVIRLLQARYKRKFDVVINPGSEQNASVSVGDLTMYPDLVLFGQERGRRLQGTIEVETGESVNTLEAMAQWGPFSRLRAPFFLFVPPNALETARRLCTEHQVAVSEIWTYHTAADQVRFTMVHRTPEEELIKVKGEPTKAARAEKPKADKEKPKAEKPKADKRSAKTRTAAAKSKKTSAKKAGARKAVKSSRTAKAAKKASKSSKRR
jgi:hypothetical protein